jgi:cytochrome c-type biogenesis protein CcsB
MAIAFDLSLAGYFMALLLASADLFFRRQLLAKLATAILAAGFVAQTAYISLRWHAAARAPLTNLFESLVLFAWAVVVVYLVVRTRVRIPVLAVSAALIALLALAYASTFESDIKPLMPALRSNWLTVHVLTCFLGYGAFAVACASSISYLVSTARKNTPRHGAHEKLEDVSAKTIAFGFLFLTMGIMSGAVWANSAWGTYWQWDPKETWSLVTWFVYAVYLHCRFMRGWKGRRAAAISVAGFAAVLFTYFGVNFLLSGLHSYAAS